ncbi:MAG: hypothetical protein ABIN69_07885 [Aestuariivirga sp.]
MFRKKTVIIVGAGASRDFGFPLGPELLDLLRKCLVQGRQEFRNKGGLYGQIGGKELLLQKYRLLYQHAGENQNLELGFDVAALDAFQHSIDGQTITSIDRFLRDHPEHSEIGRFLIALEIVARSYSKVDTNDECFLPDFSTGASTEWIAFLINELREGASDASELRENKLTIVNFNYDTTIERALDAQFSKTSRHKGASWKDCVKMLHVYGQVAPLEKHLRWSNFFSQVQESAKTLSYIDGRMHHSPDFSSNLNTCANALVDAEKVCSIGFAFDEANNALLGLSQNHIPEKTFALNYDGNVGLNNRLRNLGVTHIFQPTGGEKVLPIKQALEYGLIP